VLSKCLDMYTCACVMSLFVCTWDLAAPEHVSSFCKLLKTFPFFNCNQTFIKRHSVIQRCCLPKSVTNKTETKKK